MSFTDEGYTKDTIDEIVNRIVGRLLDTYPTLSLDPSNWIYQLVKVVSLEVLYQENIVENAVANMTVMGASGVFLDYHGAENGIFRKSAEYAIGYINPTSISRTADTTVYIPEGTTFATTDGLEFITVEQVGFVHEIPMTHTSGGIGSQDIIPRYYVDFTVDEIVTSSDVPITATYTIVDQVLEWTQDPGLAPGVSYKIKPDATQPYILSIYSRAVDIGTDGNTGIGAVTINTDSAQWVNIVTNLSAFTGGVTDENDVDFRYRIFQSRRRHFTFENIRDLVNNIDGVDDCRVYQTLVSDYDLQNPWDPIQTTTYRLDNTIITDSYSQDNKDTDSQVGNGTIDAAGMSFTGDGGVLTRARLWLKKVGTLTEYATAKIYIGDATAYPDKLPTGSALATSTGLIANDIGTDYQIVDFEFEDAFTLVDTEDYFIVLEYDQDVSNYLCWGTDTSSLPGGANYVTYSPSTWSVVAAEACFYIHTERLDTNEYNMVIANILPSQFIGTMKGFTLHTKCHKVTKVPDLFVYFIQHGEDGFSRPEETHLSDVTIDYGDMVDVGLDTYRDLFVALPFNGLDHTNTYRIQMYSPNADSENYWTFDTNTDNVDIDDSWRTEHVVTSKIVEYASDRLHTGAALAPGGDYNDEGDFKIMIANETDNDDISDSSGTVIIDDEEYTYESYASDVYTIDSTAHPLGLTRIYTVADVVTTTNVTFNGAGDSLIKTKIAITGHKTTGIIVINDDQYTYSDITTNYITITPVLTTDYTEDDEVSVYTINVALGVIDEVITLKTYFGANAYTISVIPKTGVSFADTLLPQIQALVNYEDGGGYSPVCVQVNITECEELEMDINSAILSIEDGYTFDNVVETIKTNISLYLAGLHPGDDVIYSQVEKAILVSAGIYRVRELEIEINGETANNLTEYDLRIGDNNYVVLGSSLSFTQE